MIYNKIRKIDLYSVTILFSVVLIGMIIYIVPEFKAVDFVGFVDVVRIDEDNKFIYVTATNEIGDRRFTPEIKIPFSAQCKTFDGKKYILLDIKKGDIIITNLNQADYSSSIHIVRSKGKIQIIPLSHNA